MNEQIVAFAATRLIPAGLILIMLGLGMSLVADNFARLLVRPRAAVAGVMGQLLLLPALAWLLATMFQLSPELALVIIILAACPGGVTSNGLVFAARGDVALSVSLTAISSIVTIFTAPLLITMGADHFYEEAAQPTIDATRIVYQLFQLTLMPLLTGMIFRHYYPVLAERCVNVLRPVSVWILVGIVGISTLSSLDLLIPNLVRAAPVVMAMSVGAIALGSLLGAIFGLSENERMTIGIEVGVQNATSATFLSLAVFSVWELAIIPTLYGIAMLANAGLFVWTFKLGAWSSRAPA